MIHKIEKVKKELDQLIQSGKKLNSESIVKISQELDKLIVEYMKMVG